MSERVRKNSRLLLPVALLALLLTASKFTSDPQAQAQAPPPGADACPGQPMPVQATGVYQPKPVPEIVINGQPGPGAIWQPGMRSYWHCHAGGQIMMVFDGVGRVQQRGQKMRTLHKGETEYAGPSVEHWHGAAPDSSAQFFQTSIGVTTTLWMEEVGKDDYNGNDLGIRSREEFIKTGVRKKADVPVPPGTPAPAAAPASRPTPTPGQ